LYKRNIGGMVQVDHMVAANGSLGTGVRKYFYKDHLGSVVAITNASGVIVQRLAFDPWGARRNMDASSRWLNQALPLGTVADDTSEVSVLGQFAKHNKPTTNRVLPGMTKMPGA
jgi:hypothetical protein